VFQFANEAVVVRGQGGGEGGAEHFAGGFGGGEAQAAGFIRYGVIGARLVGGSGRGGDLRNITHAIPISADAGELSSEL
jgi:hypothetical protein